MLLAGIEIENDDTDDIEIKKVDTKDIEIEKEDTKVIGIKNEDIEVEKEHIFLLFEYYATTSNYHE